MFLDGMDAVYADTGYSRELWVSGSYNKKDKSFSPEQGIRNLT